MKYILHPNAQRAIASMPSLDDVSLERMSEWCEDREKSVTHGLLRSDQSYEDRVLFLHQLLDVEAVYRAVVHEWSRRAEVARKSLVCETCDGEGHVTSEDYPYSLVVECPKCNS